MIVNVILNCFVIPWVFAASLVFLPQDVKKAKCLFHSLKNSDIKVSLWLNAYQINLFHVSFFCMGGKKTGKTYSQEKQTFVSQIELRTEEGMEEKVFGPRTSITICN